MLDDAEAALRRGEVVVLPTDTVYGVAVAAAVGGATDALFAVKERPREVALPVLVADLDQARTIAELPAAAASLAARHWPGGLTIVVRRRPSFTADLGGVDPSTVGVRVPAHDVPRELARRVGPLVTTSANRHGRPTPETAAAVAEELGGVAVVVDGGRCAGAPSTVIAVHDDGRVEVLRPGAVDIGGG